MRINQNVSIPNFFILGAPKAGTTALSEYLREHQDIFFSYPKETNFFNDDFSNKFRRITNIETYLNQCFYNSKGYKAIGEGTVYYLYSKVAVDNILKFNPEAKFIVMLRNPVEMAYSLYSTTYLAGDETVDDFKIAWGLQKERRSGKKIPKTCRDPQVLQYGELCMTGKQTERVSGKIDSKNLKIICFEDFKNNTLNVYKDVLMFLNIEYDNRTVFPVINENKVPRSKFFIQITEKTGRINIGLLKRKLGIKPGVSLLGPIAKLNYKSVERPKLDDSFILELKDYFKDDIKLLESVINKNLSHWYQ